MKKVIVRLKPNFTRRPGASSEGIKDDKGNNYNIHYTPGFIEVREDIAEQLSKDSRVFIEGSEEVKEPKEIEGEDIKIKAEEEPKKHTKTELKNMDKGEQIDLLNKLGSTIIPKREGGRIEYILKLESKL